VPARKIKEGAQTWLTKRSRNQVRFRKGGACPRTPSPPWWNSFQKLETWSQAIMAITMPLAKSMNWRRPTLDVTEGDSSGGLLACMLTIKVLYIL